MQLIDFINSHEDWEKTLQSAPYNLTIKWSGKYFICNYNMIESDFHYTEVQEARGSIFKWNEKLHKAKYVCHPFNKFFNYGEELAASIDWKFARVTEKIDGSLMKMWWQDAKWHLSTNGMIDAFAAPVSDFGITFGQLFEKALGYSIQELGMFLNKNYTYCFELTTPESRVVIDYDSAVWFLTAFEKMTGYEMDAMAYPRLDNVRYPHWYDLTSLDDVLKVVNAMDKTHEGVVVADIHSNRIKVKSPEYLMAAHLRNNGAITKKKIIEYFRNNQLDDFLAYCPQYKETVEQIRTAYRAIIEEIEDECEKVYEAGPYATRKDFALAIKDCKWKSYLFDLYDRPAGELYNPVQWLLDMPLQKMADLIKE